MTPHISVSLLGTQSDERLASLAGSGHERAFEAIVERYSKALTRYAQRFLGEARAEEVVQAAFLSAWSALTTGTEVRDLRPWLYRIVHNGALNAMNRSESGDLELIEATATARYVEAIEGTNAEILDTGGDQSLDRLLLHLIERRCGRQSHNRRAWPGC